MYGTDGYGGKLLLFEYEYSAETEIFTAPEKVTVSSYFEFCDWGRTHKQTVENLQKLNDFKIDRVSPHPAAVGGTPLPEGNFYEVTVFPKFTITIS